MISGDALWDIYYKISDLQETVTEQNVYSAEYLGNYLALAGKLYFAQTDTFDIIAGEQYNVSITKGLSEGITGYEVEKTGRYGIVTGISYGSLYIDIDSNTYSVKSLTADETSERMFMLSSGMMSSLYEGLVWEQLTGEKGISTVSVFAQAYDEDIELLGITKENVEEQLEKLNTDDETKQAVKEAAESGMIVTIPERDVTMGDWTGTGYIVTNPETGEGSYMISGGYNGGMLDCIVTASMIFSYFLTVLDNAILIISMLPFAATIMATPLNLFIAMIFFAMIFYTFFMYLIHEQFQEMYELWEIYMETGDIDVALYIICGTIGIFGGTLLGGVLESEDFLKLLKGGSSGTGSVAGDVTDDVVDEATDLKIKPSNPYNADAKPKGKPAQITDKLSDANRRSLIRENEAAETLAKNGYDIEQNPNIAGTSKKPDYLIEGEIFDCYSPEGNTSVRNVWSAIKKKIERMQTERVVLNLDDWGGDITELITQLNNYPILGLKEVIVVRNGMVQSIYP